MGVSLLALLAACPREPGGKGEEKTVDTAASVDADGDGYPAGEDCDDADSGVHPGAPDACDGVDQDCDGDAVGEGSCADLESICDGAVGYWAASGSETTFAGGRVQHLDDGAVVITAMLNYGYEGWDAGGLAGSLLGGVPPDSHDWRESALGTWAGQSYEHFLSRIEVAGDVDGDGNDDVWLITDDMAYDQMGYLWLVPGPASDWDPRGAFVEDVAVSRWVSAEPNDTLGWWAHAAEDVDRDGLPDLLVLTRGITDVGVLALIPGREGGYPRENALLDSPWIAYDAMSLSEVAAVPDLDGDGFLDVLAVQYHGAEWFSGATLAGCAGCAEADTRGVVFPEVGDLLFYEAAPSPDGGDLDGDGIHELVLVSVDRERVTEQGSCISWVDGATVGAGVAMLVDETTRACKSSAYDVGTGLRSSSDIDGDGLPDPVWDYDDYLEGTQLCTALTTRLAPGARVELMDASWCLGGNLGAVGDFSGDGVPDFIGAAAALPDDVPNCGAIPMMLGFEIPFDDASKW